MNYTSMLIMFLSLTGMLFSQRTFKDIQNQYERVKEAREKRQSQIDSLFRSLNIPYPPYKVLIIGYKNEQILELWAMAKKDTSFRLVKQYNFTAYSGKLGPKRRQGDSQIPEGFYYINCFNPESYFHLALGINYPNKSDRILGERGNLGGDICIHGSAVTIGCIPIGDEWIEELYLICVDTKSKGQKNIPVYIFPCQMDSAGMEMLKEEAKDDYALLLFWKNLKEGHDLFYKHYRELRFRVNRNGKYIFYHKN